MISKDEATVHPLSYGQRALWYVQRLIPESPVYNLHSDWRILSDFDIPALRRTFQWLVDRHSSLRTTYGVRGRKPVQLVHPHQDVHFRIHDAADWSEEEFEAEINRETGRPFDLEKGPLIRVNLILREPGNNILLTSFHHITVDLWSLTLIFEELQRLYAAAREGKTPPPPPKTAYTDYVAWQSEMLRGAEGERLWRYWAPRFEDDIRQLEIPTDFIRTAKPCYDGGALPFKLDQLLTSRLRELGQRTHSTLYTVLLGGFEALLHLMTGREKFLIRTLTVGRSRAEHEKIVGFFANPVVLRADFSDVPDFIQVLARAQESVTEAIEHQDFPFEFLMERLRFGRHLGFNPMSEVMFILQTPQRFAPERREQRCQLESGMFASGGTGIRVNFGGMLAEKFNPPTRTTLNDLDIQTVEIGGELSGVIDYRTDLFRPETIERLARNLKLLLELAAEDPHRRIDAFAERLDLPGRAGIAAPELRTTVVVRTAVSPASDRASRTAAESELATIWKEVLGIENINRDDDFFANGGNSLLALQLIVLVRETFQVDLALRQLFEAPTIAGLADLIENAEKGISLPPPRRIERDRPLPLSFAQERLWFLDRLMGGSAFYNIPVAVRLTGPLDVSALEQSLNEVIRRHESLRTTFRVERGKPVQVISPHLVLKIPVEEISPLSENEKEAEVQRLVSQESANAFDLSRGPLLRVRILKLRPENHVAVLVVHHIAADAWSYGILVRELAVLYEAFSSGRLSPLPDLSLQYADYAFWQRQWLKGEFVEKQLAYWKEALAGAPILELPTDHPRPAVQTFVGRAKIFEIPASLAESLKSLSLGEGTTLFMSLLAVFETLLHLTTGQEDTVLGTPVAGRNRAEVGGMIGCFLNLLVLRSDLSGNPTIRELLGRVRETCLSAFAHQDVPFEKIVEALQPERDLSREPLFQTMFVLQNAPLPPLRFPGGLVLTPLDVERESTRYDLTMFLAESEGKILGWLEYNTDLFDAETISRMAERYLRLLEAAATAPDTRLSALPLLSPEERDKVIYRWNETRADFPRDKCAHELFEAQAKGSPDSIAVVSQERELTFRELNSWANRVARELLNRGAGPETIAAVCMENSSETLAAVLGTLKAGAAYVPIDPSLPDERISHIMNDCQAGWLLTHKKLESRWKNTGRPVICPDEFIYPASPEGPTDSNNKAAPDNLAYVIYTSGSTGTSKGVMVTHRSLVNYLCWAAKTYELDRGEGALHHSSIAFDFSLTSLLAPLVAGQKVVIVSPGASSLSLESALEKYRDLSLIKLTPGHAEVLGETLDPAKFRGWVRTLVLGGEELRIRHIAKWLQSAPGTKIFNEYGPTETTVGCTAYLVPEAGYPKTAVPIGRPIVNTEVYILNRYLQPVPPGIPGELYVGGEGVARGYIGRPDLTAERFIPNPFNRRPGARLYRTGDVAKYLPDGEIVYLGRKDGQVKIRGYRVEPGEIEAALELHPGVAQAAVVVHEDAKGTKNIVACVAPCRDARPSAEEIRQFLRAKLPEYMVPSSFVFLDEIPRMAGGKIDRRELKTMELGTPDSSAARVPPQNSLQERIASIWSDVLGIEKVGIHDSFFDLGGHSLPAVQVAAGLRRDFQVDIPLLSFFETPTVAHLAALIEAAQGRRKKEPAPSGASMIPLRTEGQGPSLFCIHPSGGDVSVYRHLAKALPPGFPVVGIQSRALHNAGLEHPSIESMAEEYAGLIRGRRLRGPCRLLGWSMGGAIALAVCAVLEKRGEQVEFLGLVDTDFPGAPGGRSSEGVFDHLKLFLQAAAGREPFENDETIQRKMEELHLFYDSLASFSIEKRAEDIVRRLSGQKWLKLKAPAESPKNLIMLLDIHHAILASFRPPHIEAPLFIWKAGDTPAKPSGAHEFDPRRMTSGRVCAEIIEGDHFTMFLPPHIAILAEKIGAVLGGLNRKPAESKEA